MTYEQLRVLHAVVREGTFRGAAEKLFKSQPAVSNMIKKLEQELDIVLLSRDHYRPELTEAGRVFYEKALVALEQMNNLAGFAKRLSNQEEPVVNIAVNAVCPLAEVLQTLKEIEARFPVTQIKLSTEHMGGAMEHLHTSKADIAITTQTDIDNAVMEAMAYREVKVLPVAHRDYTPATDTTMKSADAMKPYVQVIVADSSLARSKQTLDVLPGNRRWTVTDFLAKKEIIVAGMGWGGLPEYMIEKELASGDLVRLYIDGFDVRTSQLYLIRRTDKPVGIVCDAIWQAFQA